MNIRSPFFVPAKSFLSILLSLLLHVAIHGSTTSHSADDNTKLDKGGREFYLAIGAVFRDEDAFLAEWIEFHLCAGVEHFFLYNHFSSTDDHEVILRPYIDAGLVTLDQAVCDVHCQVPTYATCLSDHGHRTRWLAFIDLDEFLLPADPAALSVAALLPPYEAHGGLLVHWVIYGSAGRADDPPPGSLVIEAYPRRAAGPAPVFKCVAQPEHIARAGGHNHAYRPGRDAVTEGFVTVPFNHTAGEPASEHSPAAADVVRLHHYRTKSRAHAARRFARDAVFRLNDFDHEDIFPSTDAAQAEWLERWDRNEVHDPSAARYAACVRAGLAKRRPEGPAAGGGEAAPDGGAAGGGKPVSNEL